MPWRMMLTCLLLVMTSAALTGCSQDGPQKHSAVQSASAPDSREPPRDGEALFKQYCSSCHPNGGNVSDPDRSLHGSALKRRHITTPEDIVRITRKPISRMIRFDPSTLSDRDARIIADYILTTFK
jgi:cytochrome c6